MVEYQSTPDFYNEYISHHGILGQKWGKQNGPPYPLGSDVSTGSRLKKGADGKSSGSIIKKHKNNKGPREVKISEKQLDKEINDMIKRPKENKKSDNLSEKEKQTEKKYEHNLVKEWLEDIYLHDNFDGYYDDENPMSGEEGIKDWGSRDLIDQAKLHIEEEYGRDSLLDDDEIEKALVEAWNEHYDLLPKNRDKKTYENRPDNLSELNLNKQKSSNKMSDKKLDKILNEDYSILPKDKKSSVPDNKKETKKELKNVQKDLRKVAPELNSYFLKSKEGKDYQTHEEETGSFDKEYMYNKMNDLASKDSHFKDLYETYNSLDKHRYDLEMRLLRKK